MSRTNAHGLPKCLRLDKLGYVIDFRKEGIRKRIRLGHISLDKAVRHLVKHQEKLVEEKHLGVELKEVSFFEASNGFLAYSKSRKKTFKKDKWLIRRFNEFFNDKPLRSFTLDLVESYINWRRLRGRANGGFLSNATLNRELACLKSIFGRALLNRQIDRNPILGLKLFKENSRDRVINPLEYSKLIGFCPSHLRPMVEVAYLTAMRKGEILGLRWDQIDYNNRIITLEAVDTKTAEKREIPLDEGLIQLLKRIPRVLSSPYVFTFKGRRIKSVRTAFQKACNRAGLENFRFHDLRHCAVTNLRKAGVPESVIMSISGHKTHSVFKRYNSIDRDDKLEALAGYRRWKDSYRTPDEISKNAVSL